MWLPIVAKALSTASVVVLASVVAEVAGPFWGALVASLPVSAGPAYLFLAMQHDAAFVAASALTSCAANAATGLFLVVYALTAGKQSLLRSLGSALAVWAVASVGILQIGWTPGSALLLNAAVFSVGDRVLRRVATTRGSDVATKRAWFDLPLRAAAIAVFVTAVVLASQALGPAATGIAAVFPISLSSLLVVVHPRIGGAATAMLAATALRAMAGFGLALLALHFGALTWGTTAALTGGLCVTVAWSGWLLALKTRRDAPSAD